MAASDRQPTGSSGLHPRLEEVVLVAPEANAEGSAVQNNNRGRRWAWLSVLVVVPIPSLSAWVMFFGIEGAGGKLISFGGRLLIALLPLFWLTKVEQQPIPRLRWPNRADWILGLGAGGLMGMVVIVAYLLCAGQFDAIWVGQKLESIGLKEPPAYSAIALYVILVNPLFEEYIWRWFVLRQWMMLLPDNLRQNQRAALASLFAALCFTTHHAILLSTWVGPLVTIIGCTGVMGAALIWTALYQRSGSLWPSIMSHAIADGTIMAVATHLVFGKTW